jgi:hypothetical protein
MYARLEILENVGSVRSNTYTIDAKLWTMAEDGTPLKLESWNSMVVNAQGVNAARAKLIGRAKEEKDKVDARLGMELPLVTNDNTHVTNTTVINIPTLHYADIKKEPDMPLSTWIVIALLALLMAKVAHRLTRKNAMRIAKRHFMKYKQEWKDADREVADGQG